MKFIHPTGGIKFYFKINNKMATTDATNDRLKAAALSAAGGAAGVAFVNLITTVQAPYSMMLVGGASAGLLTGFDLLPVLGNQAVTTLFVSGLATGAVYWYLTRELGTSLFLTTSVSVFGVLAQNMEGNI